MKETPGTGAESRMRPKKRLLSRRGLLDLAVRGRVADFPPGDWESVLRGRGYEFWGLREMAPGDAFRDIDWKATARTTRHWVREYLADSPFSLVILCDASGSMAFGRKGLLQANIAAALAWSAAATGNRCGMIRFGDRIYEDIAPEAGMEQFRRIVSAAAETEPVPGAAADINAAFALLTQRMDHSLAFILSDFATPFEKRYTFQQTPGRPAGHEVYGVRVLESCEKALPPGSSGLARLRDLETGEMAMLDLGRWQSYNERVLKRHAELKARLAAMGVPVTRVTPEDDYLLKINGMLRSARHRRH